MFRKFLFLSTFWNFRDLLKKFWPSEPCSKSKIFCPRVQVPFHVIGSSRAATQSLAKTTKVYRNRGVDIGSFNILIRLRTVQIGFYRVHLPLGSMPEKHRSKKSFLSRRTVKLIIGRKKFIFFGKSQNSIGI